MADNTMPLGGGTSAPTMTLDERGNFNPWRQPWYGYNANGERLEPPPGHRLLERLEFIEPDDAVFDVYAGWLLRSGAYHAEHGNNAVSSGRWTTWARPLNRGQP